MGLITRHSGAPFQNGEILSGPDLEADIANAYGAINGNIDTTNLKDLSVTTAKIANGAITQAKLDGTLEATSLIDDAVSTVKIQDGAVTTAKLADSAVTAVKIADGTITQAKLAAGAVLNYQASFNHAATTLTTSYATVASSVHITGTVASLVVITVSFNLSWGADTTPNRSLDYTVEKGGVSLLGSGNTNSFKPGQSAVTSQITRVFLDTSPTSASSHTYALRMKYLSALFAPTVSDIVWVVAEPRN